MRLALHPEGKRTLKEMKNAPPYIRLAHVPSAQGDNSLSGRNGVQRVPVAPSLLISFVYLDKFLPTKHLYTYRDWVLDSGAFSAHQSGVKIELKRYIEVCQKLTEEDPLLTEIFALDVIGDWRTSLKNCESMWKAGIKAIPCYHRGEPEDVLKGIARDYPKIALGGVAMLRGNKKISWAGQCFTRVWPKKIHGFGFGSREHVLALPWHSVDATSWEIGPCRFGRWNTYGKMSIRGSKQNLRDEVEFYLKLEELARHKWARQMKELETQGPSVMQRKIGKSGGGGRT